MREVDLLRPRGRGGGPPPPLKPAPKPAPTAVAKPQPSPPKPPSRIGAFMPSLLRFLILVGGFVAIVYGGLYYLATNVQVQPREMTEIVDIPKAVK